MEPERVTIQAAAKRLGITESAVRKRIQRGHLEHEKQPDGRVYVYVDRRDNVRDRFPDNSYPLLVERLENEVEFLRRELERRDRILAAALERIPAIEAPLDERESPMGPGPTRTPPDAGGEPETDTERPWWRRIFG